MLLSVTGISRCYFLNKKRLKDIVRFILKSVNVRGANLSIVFATDRKIKQLNYLYRKENRVTDVLSFSMQGDKPPFVSAKGGSLPVRQVGASGGKTTGGKRLKRDSSILGDIVISVERAKKQAKKFNSTFKNEIYLYIIHGILHLVGYGDEAPSSNKKMRKKEEEILKNLLSSSGSR